MLTNKDLAGFDRIVNGRVLMVLSVIFQYTISSCHFRLFCISGSVKRELGKAAPDEKKKAVIAFLTRLTRAFFTLKYFFVDLFLTMRGTYKQEH